MAHFKKSLVAAVCLTASLSWAQPKGSPAKDLRPIILEAMEQELKRSMDQLRMKNFEAPYFMAYRVTDYEDIRFTAAFGTLYAESWEHDGEAAVEVRTGNYDFDNTDQETQSTTAHVPIEQDPAVLRHELWLLTDEAYKKALSDYLRKRGRSVTEAEKEKIPDFSTEKAQVYMGPSAKYDFSYKFWRKKIQDISTQFRKYPHVQDCQVQLVFKKVTRFIVTSEGSRVVEDIMANPFWMALSAKTQADDGMVLSTSRTFAAPAAKDLPSERALEKEIEEMAQELKALREAPVMDPYIGPAILDAESTGVLFHEAIGHRLEGERQRDDDDGQTFKGQAGKRILPEFLTIWDDPTTNRLGGESLNGFYHFDDEGVPAQRVLLVEKGILKNYLMSRRPVKDFLRSNGHGRSWGGRDPRGRMANLIVESSSQKDDRELKNLLIKECKRNGKPYGLLIMGITSGDTQTRRGQYQAFRGTPRLVYRVDAATGSQELVRGVEMVGTPLISINKIIAANKTVKAFNGYCGAESGFVPVSMVAPSTLVAEVELQRITETKRRPPLIPSPLHLP